MQPFHFQYMVKYVDYTVNIKTKENNLRIYKKMGVQIITHSTVLYLKLTII